MGGLLKGSFSTEVDEVIVSLKPILAICILVFLVCIVPLFADTLLHDWRFFKRIDLPLIEEYELLVEIRPDSEMFEQVSTHMPDVRIVDKSTGREVQYQLMVENGVGVRQSLVTVVNDVVYLPGGDTTFLLYLGHEGLYHNEIELFTPEDNFDRNVLIEGSVDGDIWVFLRENARIFDFTTDDSDFGSKETRISYPTNSFSYLRVSILGEESYILPINGAKAYFTSQMPLTERDVNIDSITMDEDSEAKVTNWVLDLGSSGIPTSRLDIHSPQKNFHRNVSIEGSDNGVDWELVSHTDFIYSYSTPTFVGNKFSAVYPETRYRYYKLKVFNDNNDSLQISEFKSQGFGRKLIFFARPDVEYAVYYGNDKATKPSYELDHIVRHLDTENLPLGILDGQMKNPDYNLPAEPFTERYSWFMPVVISLTTLVIGFFLANVSRQISGRLRPPEDEI